MSVSFEQTSVAMQQGNTASVVVWVIHMYYICHMYNTVALWRCMTATVCICEVKS